MPGWAPPTDQAQQWTGQRKATQRGANPGFHVLASPPGEQAPIDHINYTPATSEVHGKGVMAPKDKLNYTLMPTSALYPGAGGGFSQGMGMGAGAGGYGAAPPGQDSLFSRYSSSPSTVRNTFSPGQPPLSPHPYGTGPGIHSVVSGAGPRPFSQRATMSGNLGSVGQQMGGGQEGGMGAGDGADDDAARAAALKTAQGGGDTSTAAGSTTGAVGTTSVDPSSDPAQVANAVGGTWQGDQLIVVDPDGTSWTAAVKTNVPDPASGPDATKVQITHISRPPKTQVPKVLSTPVPDTAVGKSDGQQHVAQQNPDGTLKDLGVLDPGVTLKDNVPVGGEGHTVAIDAAGNIKKDYGKTQAAPSATPQPTTGVGQLNVVHQGNVDITQRLVADSTAPGGARWEDISVNANPNAAQTPTIQTVGDHSVIFDPASKTTTEIPGSQATVTLGDQLLMRDPGKSTFSVVATAPPTYSFQTDTSGTVHAINPKDPSKNMVVYSDPTAAAQAQASLQSTQASTQSALSSVDQTRANVQKIYQDLADGKITSETARFNLQLAAYQLTHPQPQATSEGWLVPPGASLTVSADQPGLNIPTTHTSGGPLPQAATDLSNQVGGFLKNWDVQQAQLDKEQTAQRQAKATLPNAPATPAPAAGTAPGTTPGAVDTTPGSVGKALLGPGVAGTAGPGGDPTLAGTTDPMRLLNPVPAPTPFAQSGVPEGSNRNLPAPNVIPRPGAVMPSAQTRPRLIRPQPMGQGDTPFTQDMGGGQDTFMGRGLTPETGRGSTGIGWPPKSGSTWGSDIGAGQAVPSGMSPDQSSPLYQEGYQAGMQANQNPGTPPIFVPNFAQPTPTASDQQHSPDQGGDGGMGGGQADQFGLDPMTMAFGGANPMAPGLGTPGQVSLGGVGAPGQPMSATPPQQSGQPWSDPLGLSPMQRRNMASAGSLGTPGVLGGGQEPAPPPPAGGAPGGPPQPPGAPPPQGQGSNPAGWTPPVQPQDVAGIGHRFGQPMNEGEPQHSGVDLQAPEGTPTMSPVDGFVEKVEHNEQGLGLTVVVRGKDGSEHRLGHLSHTDAYPGMQVAQGQSLGRVGSTGNTTGAHLHWGPRDAAGTPTDPTPALPGPMQNMPPVPGTEMMGPPGGNGGQAQAGAAAPPPALGGGAPPPGMGGGQEPPTHDVTEPGYPGQNYPGFEAGTAAPDQVEAYIRQAATQRGIDPDVAVKVAQSEGGMDPAGWWGDQGSSYFPYQEHWGGVAPGGNQVGGMGDDLTQRTGVQMGDPSGWKPSVDFALDTAKRQGWDPGANPQKGIAGGGFHGATRAGIANRQGIGGGQDNPLTDPFQHHDATQLPQDDPLLRPGGVSSGWRRQFAGRNPMAGLQPMGQVQIDPGEAFGTGQDSVDVREDLYEGKDAGGFWGPQAQDPIGAGAEGWMGAGAGATTQADRLAQVQAAGYTGPTDSASVNQAYANAATPSDLAESGISNTPQGAAPSSNDSTNVEGANTKATVGASLQNSANNLQASLANTAASIAAENDRHQEALQQLAQQAQQETDYVTIQNQINAETQRHNQATEQLQAQSQAVQLQIQQLQDANNIQNAIMQEGQQVLMQQGDQAFKDFQAQQTNRLQILSSALNNPWLTQLAGMTPGPGGPGAPVGGQNISNLVNQILQPYNPSAYLQNNPYAPPVINQTQVPGAPAVNTGLPGGNLPAIGGQNLNAPPGAQGAAAAPQNLGTGFFVGGDHRIHVGSPTGTGQPGWDPSTPGGGSGTMADPSWPVGTEVGDPTMLTKPMPAPPATTAAPTTAAPAAAQPTGQAPAGPGTSAGQPNLVQQNSVMPSTDPTWQQFQGWNPFQKAAFRTNVEAEGPGAWNAEQPQLQASFAAAGGSPNITQMQNATADPLTQAGQQMTANVFGQTTPGWQSQQQKNWSAAQAPTVKSNLSGVAA